MMVELTLLVCVGEYFFRGLCGAELRVFWALSVFLAVVVGLFGAA